MSVSLQNILPASLPPSGMSELKASKNILSADVHETKTTEENIQATSTNEATSAIESASKTNRTSLKTFRVEYSEENWEVLKETLEKWKKYALDKDGEAEKLGLKSTLFWWSGYIARKMLHEENDPKKYNNIYVIRDKDRNKIQAIAFTKINKPFSTDITQYEELNTHHTKLNFLLTNPKNIYLEELLHYPRVKGAGTKAVYSALKKSHPLTTLTIESIPIADPFYEKIGCRKLDPELIKMYYPPDFLITRDMLPKKLPKG